VVGLVIKSLNKTVIIADPNGALIGGSNMEYLTMLSTKLQSKPTTSLSCYDRMERNQTKIITEKLNAERKSEGVFHRNGLEFNKHHVHLLLLLLSYRHLLFKSITINIP
jgi:hypothetical protein